MNKQMFLRFFFQGDEKFIDDCIGFLPTKSRDQIDEHEEWYRQFLSISNKRRLALKRWREEKNVRLTFETFSVLINRLFQNVKETILQEAEQAHQTLKEIDETLHKAQLKEQERLRTERLEQIANWKRERELKKREIDEEKQREEEKKRQEEQRRFIEKEEQKKLVEQIRREREENERREREQTFKQKRFEEEVRQRTATSAIRKFRERVRFSSSIDVFF